jgi:apolipoprotein N-acyltransferase
MTWFGTLSAWAALLMGAMFAVNAYFQFATGVSGWIYAGVALLLLLGGFRTLRKMSGGLRMLAGAWGVAAGVLLMPWLGPTPDLGVTLHDTYYAVASPLSIAFVLGTLAGLALTVLHKETK